VGNHGHHFDLVYNIIDSHSENPFATGSGIGSVSSANVWVGIKHPWSLFEE
jgi:hypothetical protein